MTRLLFVLFVVLLGLELAAPTAFAKRGLSNNQVSRRAHRIVQQLKKEDPRVLRSVMYRMGWVPKFNYKKERRKKQQTKNTFDEWYIDLMRDFGGL
tara:strand:- start:425 stop:712 length:288 start_codon:yes stop_codon:yes gene_type:complete